MMRRRTWALLGAYRPLIAWAALIVTVLAVVAAVGLLDSKMKADWQFAKEAPQVSKVATTTVTPPAVLVYEPQAKAKLKLPKQVQADPKQHVLAASRVDYSLRPQTVITTIDEATGVPATYVRTEPYPWLGHNPSGSLSLAYGIRGVDPVVRLSLTQDLIQIKAANFGGVAHLDSDGAYFVGAGVNFRW